MGPDREVRIKPVLFQWLKIPGNTREYLDLHRQVWAVEVPLSTGSRSGTGPCSITLVLPLLYSVINVLYSVLWSLLPDPSGHVSHSMAL